MAKKRRVQQHNLKSSPSSENSSSSDDENPTENELSSAGTEYEKQRQARIAANKAKMEALGLRHMATSLMGSPQNRRNSNSTPKSKRVIKNEADDYEYEPNVESSDGGSDSSTDEDSDQEEMIGSSRRNRKSNAKKVKNVKSKSGKKVSVRNLTDVPDIMDEDKALKQAIALSLKDSGEISDLQCGGSSQGSCLKPRSHQEENTKRRKRKPFTSRVQMTEDDLVIHFCQFDEVGKGSITLRDVERMAATHDFMWTDKELFAMVRCFDSDRDGKLSLDDFRNIVQRCNMLQKHEGS